MARIKIKDFHEPWTTTKDQTWEVGFRFPPVQSEYIDADAIRAWEAKRETAQERATWHIWGSRMESPSITEDYYGKMHVWDGRGIIGWSTNPAPNASHEEMAKRVCECVNACQAIANPIKLIEDVRGLLLDIVRGQTGPEDKRILSCLASMIPADELVKCKET